MPIIQLHKRKTYQWAIWQIEESLDDLLTCFDDSSLYKLQTELFTSKKRQLEFIVARVLLKSILNEEKEIAYHPNGKPYLKDNSYSISISHSGKYVAVIVSASYPVGIDIELYGERIERLAPRFMREDEIPTLYNGDIRWSYLLHWSAKEVLFKMLNQENVDFKKHLVIHKFQVENKGSFTAEERKTKKNKQFVMEYKLHSKFVLTWSLDQQGFLFLP